MAKEIVPEIEHIKKSFSLKWYLILSLQIQKYVLELALKVLTNL